MIKESLLKIVFLLIIISFSLAGLLSIGQTYAFFSDKVDSNNNIFTAGTLNILLRSGQNNFVPPEIANDMSPGDSVTRHIYIKKEGSLPFQYNAHSEPISGNCDSKFYNLLELKVWYNYYTALPELPNYHEHLKYDGLLKDFDLITDSDLQIPNSHPYYPNVFYGPDEHWLYFQIIYPSEAEAKSGESCQFKFVFEGWQNNLPDSSSGFSDAEEIYSTLIDSIFIEEEPTIDNSSIVINEFLPISGNYPEFIEFYNKGDAQLDIADWIIENKDTTIVINSDILYGNAASTIIESEKWLVIDLSKIGEDILDDIDDIITLFDSENNEIDTISYIEASMADKSYARIPDGSPNWVDPIPTPGAPNKLEEEIEELEPEPESLLEEIIEEIPLITATTTTSTIPDSDILENSTSTSTTIPDQATSTTTEPLVAGAATSTTTVSTIEEPAITTTTTEPPVNENREESNSDEENTFPEETIEEQSSAEEMVEEIIEEITKDEVINEVNNEIVPEPELDIGPEIEEPVVEVEAVVEEAPVIEEVLLEETPAEEILENSNNDANNSNEEEIYE